MIKKVRKIPVEVEAIQFFYTENSIKELKEFCGDDLIEFGKARHPDALGYAVIKTLEDGDENSPIQVKHVATEGDFIIRGVSGEFYPIKSDIFYKTYEFVE